MNAHVLVIDNYDSFTYNLVQAIRQLRANVTVFRNDQLTVEDAARLDYSHLLISPGPGHPRDAGVSIPLIRSIAACMRKRFSDHAARTACAENITKTSMKPIAKPTKCGSLFPTERL